MKLFIVCVIALLSAGYYLSTPLLKEKACYDSSQKHLTDLSYQEGSNGLPTEVVCQRRTEILLDLGDCITAVRKTSPAYTYANTLMDSALSFLRPTAKGYTTLKTEHNAQCTEYQTYQLEE